MAFETENERRAATTQIIRYYIGSVPDGDINNPGDRAVNTLIFTAGSPPPTPGGLPSRWGSGWGNNWNVDWGRNWGA